MWWKNETVIYSCIYMCSISSYCKHWRHNRKNRHLRNDSSQQGFNIGKDTYTEKNIASKDGE